MYYRAQRYMKRRHPQKSGWWRTTKYWGHTMGSRQDRWVFLDKVRHATLRKFTWTKIVRHRLVPTTSSPDDPTLRDYWQQRRAKTHARAPRYRQLFHRHKGRCPGCHPHLENGEEAHIHHVLPKQHGGTDDLVNLQLVHRNCHHQLHRSRAPLGVRRLLAPGARCPAHPVLRGGGDSDIISLPNQLSDSDWCGQGRPGGAVAERTGAGHQSGQVH